MDYLAHCRFVRTVWCMYAGESVVSTVTEKRLPTLYNARKRFVMTDS